MVRADRMELRLDPEEKESFGEAAELAGMSLSAWVRDRLRRACRKELDEVGRRAAFLAKRPGKRAD